MRKILMPFNTFALLKVIGMIKSELQILIINGSDCKSELAGNDPIGITIFFFKYQQMISQLKVSKKNILFGLLIISISNLYAQYNDFGRYIEIVNYKKYYKSGPAYKIGYNDSTKSFVDTFEYSIYDRDWLVYQLNRHKGIGNYGESILTKNKDSVILNRYENNKLVSKGVMFYDSLTFPIYNGIWEYNRWLTHYSLTFDENGNVTNEYTNKIFKKIGKEKWMKDAAKVLKKKRSN
jgi:hypothetical protein